MTHTDRQPSDEIFNDIKQAAVQVWMNSHYHPSYEAEKLAEVERIDNYADNWNSIIGAFDKNNQILHHYYLKRKDTIEFLQSMRPWYSLVIPRDKV